MSELKDIKDSGPSKELIKRLERLLEEAKAGDILSLLYVVAWPNQTCQNGWIIDKRTSWRKIFAEAVLMQHDIATELLLQNPKSSLHEAFRDGIE